MQRGEVLRSVVVRAHDAGTSDRTCGSASTGSSRPAPSASTAAPGTSTTTSGWSATTHECVVVDAAARRRRRSLDAGRRPPGRRDRVHPRPRRPRQRRGRAGRRLARPDPAAPRRPDAVGQRAPDRQPDGELADGRGLRGRRRRRRGAAHPRATRPARAASTRPASAWCSPATRSSGRPGRDRPLVQRLRDDHRVDPRPRCSRCRPTRSCSPATATRRRSAPRPAPGRSGSPAVTEPAAWNIHPPAAPILHTTGRPTSVGTASPRLPA